MESEPGTCLNKIPKESVEPFVSQLGEHNDLTHSPRPTSLCCHRNCYVNGVYNVLLTTIHTCVLELPIFDGAGEG